MHLPPFYTEERNRRENSPENAEALISGAVHMDQIETATKWRKVLLMCGILASLVYAGTDILAGILYPGYSFTAQAVSELFAIGAPTSHLVVSLFTAHSLLLLAFASGIWASAGRNRALRIMAIMIVGNAISGVVLWNFFSMHMRGVEKTLTDTMHLILAVDPFILLTIIFGAAAFQNGFRF
jgi:Protein of unknown function (DUF998)